MATIKIDGDEVEIRWTNRAKFRLGMLERVPAIEGLHAFAGLCAWIWAMLPRDASQYKEPADIADAIHDDEVAAAFEALNQTLEESAPSKEDSPKKDSSGRKRKSASKPD